MNPNTASDTPTPQHLECAREIYRLAESEANNGMLPDKNDMAKIITRHFPAAEAEGRKEPQWQPIETAPKLSQSILGFCTLNLCQYVISWDDTEESWVLFGGWDKVQHPITHWMPLPASPAQTNQPPVK